MRFRHESSGSLGQVRVAQIKSHGSSGFIIPFGIGSGRGGIEISKDGLNPLGAFRRRRIGRIGRVINDVGGQIMIYRKRRDMSKI